jgi:tetratricopeptide (TPR) repeat protein
MQCPKCNQENPDGVKFCSECGEKMPSSIGSDNNIANSDKENLTSLAVELKDLFEKNEDEFWSKIIEISEKEPNKFIELSSEMMKDEVLRDDASLRLLRGSSYARNAVIMFKSQNEQWNNSSLDLLEKSLIDLKAADDFKVKSGSKRKIDAVLEERIDATATMLEKNRPGKSIEILGKTKLKYLAGRVFISSSLDPSLVPSDEAKNIFYNIFFSPPQIIRSAAIMSKILGEGNNHRIDVALFEDISPKNAFGEASHLVDIVSLYESGNYNLQFSKDSQKTQSLEEGALDVKVTPKKSINQGMPKETTSKTQFKESTVHHAQDIKADLKKAAGETYSKLLNKSKVLKDAIESGEYKKILDNEFIKKAFAWFRVSDERFRILVYTGWSSMFYIFMMSLMGGATKGILGIIGGMVTGIPMGVVMGLYVYSLGAISGPLNKFLKKINEWEYGWIITMPFFTLPWYAFGWPSEKLYSLFFYKYTCLSIGIGYLQNGDYSKALEELEKAKVSKNDKDGTILLYASLGDVYTHLERYEEAISSYIQATQYDPEDISLKLDLAYCYALKGQYNESLKVCREALKADNENINIFLMISRCYLEMGMYDDAITYLKQALSLEPQNATTHKMIAEAYMGLGDDDNAVKEAKLSLTLNPDPNIAEGAQEIIDDIQYGPAEETARDEVKTVTAENIHGAPAIHTEPVLTVESNSLFCANQSCNKEISRDSLFCGYCGTKVVLS